MLCDACDSLLLRLLRLPESRVDEASLTLGLRVGLGMLEVVCGCSVRGVLRVRVCVVAA